MTVTEKEQTVGTTQWTGYQAELRTCGTSPKSLDACPSSLGLAVTWRCYGLNLMTTPEKIYEECDW